MRHGEQTDLQRQILEHQKLGLAGWRIAKKLGCNPGYVYRLLEQTRNPSQTQRLAIIEEMCAEILAIVRQLSRLPRSTIEARAKELEAQMHRGGPTSAT